MSKEEELASRLRQAIQGCSIHNHGPVQAWLAIVEASDEGSAQIPAVAMIALNACEQRIADLTEAGVKPDDPRMTKERLTYSFIQKLLG